ncbi:MAG: thiamine pyrophosphate-requiring protein [Actinomycetia bacterium]|nr:thiamine pyrophosphate-requiring protein [Actinomycetes bacterium]
MKAAALIADVLKREGVELLFGYPLNPLIESAAELDIRPIIVRQERTGLHMADAYSRLNSGNRLGVFCMQFGPGTENAFGGVAQAYSDSVPILVLPTGYARELTNRAPNFNAFLNFQHVTKACEQVTAAATLPDVLRRSFSLLRNGRPRPVLVELPNDLFVEEVESFAYSPSVASRAAPDPDDVRAAAQALLDAKRPVLYAGQGVHYAEAWLQLQELAELLSIPVTTSLQGKSAFPENHPLSLGSGGRALPAPVTQFLAEADVIFGVGCSFTSTAYGVSMPPGKTVIHQTLDPNDLGHDVAVTHPLLGDSALALDAVLCELRDRGTTRNEARTREVGHEIARAREAWIEPWLVKLSSDETPLSPYRIIRDLMRTVDRSQTVITHDAGSPRDQLSPFWESTVPLSYIGWGKTTQLGYGLGLAMGAKLARPDHLCINVWGDAAIGFTGMDFETAVRERIPILSILLNNFSMAIELPVMPTSTEKYRSTDISGNYADFARALGGYGERVTEVGEIVPAIERGIEQTLNGTPALLEFITAKEFEYPMPQR